MASTHANARREKIVGRALESFLALEKVLERALQSFLILERLVARVLKSFRTRWEKINDSSTEKL